MTGRRIERASLSDLRAMRDRGETKAPDPDAAGEDMPDGFWEAAVVETPAPKRAVSLRVDPDILEYFREQGAGYQTRMHSVLRAYVDGMRARRPDPPPR